MVALAAAAKCAVVYKTSHSVSATGYPIVVGPGGLGRSGPMYGDKQELVLLQQHLDILQVEAVVVVPMVVLVGSGGAGGVSCGGGGWVQILDLGDQLLVLLDIQVV